MNEYVLYGKLVNSIAWQVASPIDQILFLVFADISGPILEKTTA